MMQPSVAALFVDASGVYAELGCVDLWDESRDAREYPGPHPVVAHPPCHLWTNLSRVNYKRYGGEHNRPGNDGGCFVRALGAILQWGGVLEHPAFSHAWKAHGLQRPVARRWLMQRNLGQPLWVCEVWQSAYGHKARKRTWLAYCRDPELPDRELFRPPPEMDWSRPSGTHQCGWFDRIKPTLSKREASATPPAFRDALVELARTARAA